MTDKERVEEYIRKVHYDLLQCGSGEPDLRLYVEIKFKQAYLDGLAEGRKEKWHKVADGDLPKHTRYVWTNVGPSYYDDDRDSPCWRDEFGRTQGVIAWCEPKFKE